ncbi:DgyrCDS1243 [Dimorphilus gyrociliatus]|uniref:Spliceosome-associated protein CWC27 homolog n=1 Tax=Dimorphilus gyrociliatus TaxID=2664684 RepID=A0A7I8V9U4_9ANNE|nr:DgyrCDS1243 [Dimorphilus gyrociliatus]
MSNIYINEPPTRGKVLLVTTAGDIDVELWSKECPKACRNFVQLCMEGYYNDTIFHRMVKDFIVQGGDPTGTGEGGDSIYGEPFKDEFHTRLRFVRRGLLAMANSGKDDNGSQFFFTLGEARELNNKHTIFGKVAGNTIYNMIKLGDSPTDSNERPLNPYKIIKTEILSNPFDDIEPREIAKKSEKQEKVKTSKSKATKNFSLLSFGEEAEEDERENEAFTTENNLNKDKSIHSEVGNTITEKLTAAAAFDADIEKAQTRKKFTDSEEDTEDEEERKAMKARISEKLKKKTEIDPYEVKSKPGKKDRKLKRVKERRDEEEEEEEEEDDDDEYNPEKKKRLKLEQMRKEQEKLKMEIIEKRNSAFKNQNEESSSSEEEVDDVVKEYRQKRQKQREERQFVKKGSDREKETMKMLSKFQNKLESVKKMKTLLGPVEEDNEEDEFQWMTHTLSFEEHNRKVIDANVKELDRYELYDPRNPLNVRRRKEAEAAAKDHSKSRSTREKH